MNMPDLKQQHADNVLRAVERQRNDALSREAQKDAIIALLQAQASSMTEQAAAKDAKIGELESRVGELETKIRAVAVIDGGADVLAAD